jgi:hypothetical protein
MPKLLCAVFCQQALVDQFTNNFSIINQIDELKPIRPGPQSPTPKGKKARALAVIQCALVSIWERDKPTLSESSELLIELRGPKRESLAKITAVLDLRKHRRVRQIGNIPGIPLVGEGTYRFILRCRDGVRWRRAGEVTFQIAYGDTAPPGRTH